VVVVAAATNRKDDHVVVGDTVSRPRAMMNPQNAVIMASLVLETLD
jgi:hypothetical protein